MKKVLLFLALMQTIVLCISQENYGVDQFEAWKPEYIKKTNGTPNGIAKDQSWQEWCEARIRRGDLGTKTNDVWIAYSDRSDNPTYSAPNYTERTGKSMSYCERVYIAKVQDGFALVFKDNKKTYKISDVIGKTAEFLGWVPIENLLLWVECPKGVGQIYNKALVVWDPDIKNDDASPQRNPNYILNPSSPKSVSSLTARDLDILFVMKKTVVNQTTYYLLADVSDIKDISTSLKGWLPHTYITEWNQRLTLEPSNQITAVNEYTKRGLKPVAFMEMKYAENYYNLGTSATMENAVYQHEDFNQVALEPEIMRHPIIENTENDHIFKVAVMTGLGGDKNKGQGYVKQKAQNERDIEQLTKKMKNINVIFVIDATHSMVNYYKPVANALKNAMQQPFFKDHDADTKIRVGAVLYRDYPDHQKKGMEIKSLTEDLNDVANFLMKVDCRSIDPDEWEAMFDGLKTALDCNKMGYSPDQSNFVILIGDAGNRPTYKGKDLKPEEKEIADLMFKNNINFMAYQVHNRGKDEYSYFQRQVGRIQNNLVSQYEVKIHDQMKFKPIDVNLKKLVRENGNDDLLIHVMQKFVNKDEDESASKLSVQVLDLVQSFYNKTRDRITFLRNASEGGYKFSNAADEARLSEALRLAGWNENRISNFIRFQKDGGVAKLKCYAPECFKGAKRSAYRYVLFFSEKELTELLKNLKKVDNSRENSVQAYQQALINLGMAMLGDFEENDIKKMDVEEMMSKIYGVPIKIKTTAGKISNIPYLDEDRLQELMRKFNEKTETLQGIRDLGVDQSSYLRRFEKNGTRYYWIPFETLPGFEVEAF